MGDLGDDRSKYRRDFLSLFRAEAIEIALTSRHLTGHDVVEVLAQFADDRRGAASALVVQELLDVLGDDPFGVFDRLAAIAQRLTDPFTKVVDIDASDVGEAADVARDGSRESEIDEQDVLSATLEVAARDDRRRDLDGAPRPNAPS